MRPFTFTSELRGLRFPLLAAAAVALASCAGSRSYVSAPTARYPVSFSPTVRDSDGKILSEKNLKKVGDFTFEYSSVHMFWTMIPLSRNSYDISPQINKQVDAAKGQAIVNCKVTAYKNLWNMWAMLLSMGFLPAYSGVGVTGDIVVKK